MLSKLLKKFRGKREMTIDEIMLGILLMRVTNGDPTKKLIIEKMDDSYCPECDGTNLTEDKTRCGDCDGGPG